MPLYKTEDLFSKMAFIERKATPHKATAIDRTYHVVGSSEVKPLLCAGSEHGDQGEKGERGECAEGQRDLRELHQGNGAPSVPAVCFAACSRLDLVVVPQVCGSIDQTEEFGKKFCCFEMILSLGLRV